VRNRIRAMLVVSLLLAGCAGTHSENDALKAAREERDEAYARLLRAIGSYCSRHEVLENRHRCLLEKRLELLGPEGLRALADAWNFAEVRRAAEQ
jgi:hypothetical protein